MPDTQNAPRSTSPKQDDATLSEVIDTVKLYAEQEIVGPLKGAGRWLGFGAAGSFTLALGLMLMLLGGLRALQTEWDRSASGSFSWVSYALVFVVTLVLLAITISRIKKSTLNNEPK